MNKNQTTNKNQKIVLASASPRRKRMFEDMKIAFEVIPADIEEIMLSGETPVEFALRTAGEKGLEVAIRLSKKQEYPWIVAADTIVVLGDEVLTKPIDANDARNMLTKLSGKTHVVITGWVVGKYQCEWVANYAATNVTFHKLTIDQIEGYVASGEGMDKAGSYAIQDVGAFLVDRIEGNYFNVVGLPVSHVVRTLIAKGAINNFLNS